MIVHSFMVVLWVLHIRYSLASNSSHPSSSSTRSTSRMWSKTVAALPVDGVKTSRNGWNATWVIEEAKMLPGDVFSIFVVEKKPTPKIHSWTRWFGKVREAHLKQKFKTKWPCCPDLLPMTQDDVSWHVWRLFWGGIPHRTRKRWMVLKSGNFGGVKMHGR